MSHEEGSRCECIGLHFDVRTAGGAEEAGLASVGEARKDESAGVGVDGRQTANVLAHALEAVASSVAVLLGLAFGCNRTY